MCRGCFSTLLLKDDLYAGGSGGIFGRGRLHSTRRNFMAFSVAAAGAAATAGGANPAIAADAGADVIFKGGKIIPVPGAAPVEALAVGGGKSWRSARRPPRRD